MATKRALFLKSELTWIALLICSVSSLSCKSCDSIMDDKKKKERKEKKERKDKKDRKSAKASGKGTATRRKRRIDFISDDKSNTPAVMLLEGCNQNVREQFTWSEGDLLGTGAFAKVFKGTSNSTKEVVAVKVIDKSQVGKEVSPKSLQTEVEVLKSIDHPNIIKLKGVFEDADNLYIVTEIAVGGELFERILNKGAYSERYAAELVKRILSGIDYLHDRKIVHRDLKPENLLLYSDNDLDIRICDFGLAKVVGSNTLIQTVVGSPNYVAPEVLQGMGYWKQADLWSIGVITYILLCGYPPFASPDIRDLLDMIQSGVYEYEEDYWEHISDLAKDFIDHLLVVNPDSRYTAKQALDHPWLKKCEGKKEEEGKVLEVGNQMKETLEEWRGKAEAGEDRYAQFGEEGEFEGEGGSVELKSAPYNCTIPISTSGVVEMSVGKSNPSLSFYRYLYSTIGAAKGWSSRSGMSDVDLEAILSDPNVFFGVLSVNGSPAGLVELDARNSGEVEIVHLGVLPEHSRRESAYLKVLVEFAVAVAFSQSGCGRLFAKETGDAGRTFAALGFTSF